MFEQLNDVFKAAAFKYLSKVDADPQSSNQHEIGGLLSAGIGQYLGTSPTDNYKTIPATLVYLEDDGSSIINEDTVTWYDCRCEDPTRSAEWRLYYKSNDVSERFRPGDFFLIALTYDNQVLMFFCPPNGDYEHQIRTIFGAQNLEANLRGSLKRVDIRSNIAYPIRLMFARYGLEIGHSGTDHLSLMLERFGEVFPKTRTFSEFAREHSPEICPIQFPDKALIQWMETEESAFRQFERHVVKQKLKVGFGESGDDVDEFVSFSLSVQNRRKSRSGHAFENHIEYILKANSVEFERGALTEDKQKPDFLFPSSSSYRNEGFPVDRLRILGAKTTCKDRWRQVLVEGRRIEKKHLITLEHAISEAQTEQMRVLNLQLVVPLALHDTYTDAQRTWLMTFGQFISEVKSL